jgi:homeobox protein ESX1
MNAQRIGPSLAALGLTTALVVVTHFALLLGATEALQVSLRTPPASTLPFQTRSIVMPSQVTAPAAPATVKSTVRTAASPKAATPTAASPTADEALRAPELEKTEPAPPIRIPAEPATPPSAEVLAQTADKTALPSPQAPPIPPTPPNEPLPPATPAPRVLAVGALPPSTVIIYKLAG